MEGLRVLIQIDPDKRQEFIQSVQALLPERDNKCYQHLLLQSVNDQNMFCVIVEFASSKELAAYMHSDKYRVLLGAATVLGAQDKLDIAEYETVAQIR